MMYFVLGPLCKQKKVPLAKHLKRPYKSNDLLYENRYKIDGYCFIITDILKHASCSFIQNFVYDEFAFFCAVIRIY